MRTELKDVEEIPTRVAGMDVTERHRMFLTLKMSFVLF